MRSLVLAGVALLSACSSKVDDMKHRYTLVEKSGTLGDVCAAANNVKQAYLEANDTDGFRYWNVIASIRCMTARMEGEGLPADGELRNTIKAETDKMTDDALNVFTNTAQ